VEPELEEEFCAIRNAVYDGLRFGTYIDRMHSVPVCQYLVLPAFENPFSWDVIRVAARGAGAQARLYRSCWRMDRDQEAFGSPVERLKYPRPFRPAVEVGWALIDLARVETLLARIRSIRVPLAVVNPPSGCDGVSYELSVGGFFCNARVGWWCDMPGEWQALRPVVAELVEWFELVWADRPERAATDRPRD
jgi:hypothetical protein